MADEERPSTSIYHRATDIRRAVKIVERSWSLLNVKRRCWQSAYDEEVTAASVDSIVMNVGWHKVD